MQDRNSTYAGDTAYSIKCDHDVTVGDEVQFMRAVFNGSYPHTEYAGLEMVTGKVIGESICDNDGKRKHTFTIETQVGKKTRITGKNLYKNGVWRKPWKDEFMRTMGSSGHAAQHRPQDPHYVQGTLDYMDLDIQGSNKML